MQKYQVRVAMTPVAPIAAPPHFLALRDPEWSEAKGNLHNWMVALIIAHVLVLAGFLKLAELYHPRLVNKTNNAICLILKTINISGESTGNSASSASAGRLLKQHKSLTVAPSAPRTQPTHQLKVAPTPTPPTHISHILPEFNSPKPAWVTPPEVQKAQDAPEAETASTAGGAINTKGNEGSVSTGRESGTSSGVGNSGLTGNGTSSTPGGGNIGPYRKYLLVLLSKKWKPPSTPVDVVLRLKVSRAGELISAEIYQSSGNDKADSAILKAANSIKYPPLPSWFGGRSLTFQIEMVSSGKKQ
jgi:TonB family protein